MSFLTLLMLRVALYAFVVTPAHGALPAMPPSAGLVSTVFQSSSYEVQGLAVFREQTLLIHSYYGIFTTDLFGRGETLIAGTLSTNGYVDGVGPAARFSCLWQMALDEPAMVLYATDMCNHCLRKVDLRTWNATTLAGNGSYGGADGVGSVARFTNPSGIAIYAPVGVLYVADFGNGIRRVVVSTTNVTTIASAPNVDAQYLTLSRTGTFFYASEFLSLCRFNNAQNYNATCILADEDADEYFYLSMSVLSPNESTLMIANAVVNVIQALDLTTLTLTTIAGTRDADKLADGFGPNASFQQLNGIVWHCNRSSAMCGVLVSDSITLRFVTVEPYLSGSAPASPSSTISTFQSQTTTGSILLSATQLRSDTASETASSPASLSVTRSRASLSHQATTSFSPLLSMSRSITATVTQWVSWRSSTTTKSSNGSSHTLTPSRRTSSASPTMYCGLVAAPGRTILGTLFPVRGDVVPSSAVMLLSSTANEQMSSSLLPEGLNTVPVSRGSLNANVRFVLNISLGLAGTMRSYSAADGWSLVNVALDVIPVDTTFPVMTTTGGNYDVLSSTVLGREQFLVCRISPPGTTTNASSGGGGPRWVPSTLSPFRAVTLRLQLVMRCPTDAAVTEAVRIDVAAPALEVELVAEVKAAGTTAQYTAAIAGISAGSSIARVGAVRSLVLCSKDSTVTGLIPMPLSAMMFCTNTDDTTALLGARGAVLGNFVVWVAACVLVMLVTVGYSLRCDMTMMAPAEALGMPSPLLPVVVVTIPTTVTGTFLMLAQPSCGADVAIAMLGLIMSVAPVGGISVVCYLVSHRLHATPRHAEAAFAMPWQPSILTGRVIAFVKRLFFRRMRWTLEAPTSSSTTKDDHRLSMLHQLSLRWDRAATVIVLEYAVLWYLIVDVSILTLSSALGSIRTLESGAACRASAIVIVGLYLTQLIVCVLVKPFTTLFSHVHALFSLSLTTLGLTCQVAHLYASQVDGVDLESLSGLLTTAAVCDLVVYAVSILRTLVDGIDALRAGRRHIRVVLAGPVLGLSTQAGASHKEPVPLANLMVDLEEVSLQVLDSSTIASVAEEFVQVETTPVLPHSTLDVDDFRFWHSDGTAVVVTFVDEF